MAPPCSGLLLLGALLPPKLASAALEPSLLFQEDDAAADRVSLLQRAGYRKRWDPPEVWAPQPVQGPMESAPVPQLIVDLDAAPELRWRNVTQHFLSIGAFPECCKLPKDMEPLAEGLFKRFTPMADEIRRELAGIVSHVNHPEVSVLGLLVRNWGYELGGGLSSPEGVLHAYRDLANRRNETRGCSAVIAAQADGTVVHGRNMDFRTEGIVGAGGRELYLPEMTAEVTMLRKGQPLLTSVHWPGLVGVHTAMRFGGWSFQQNTRDHGMPEDMMYGLTRQGEAFMLGARRIMEETPDFETAVQRLYEGHWMAPQYFVLAGPEPYQGAVVTVDRGGEHRQATPAIARLTREMAPVWHLVQTNDDRNQAPHDYRRGSEEERLLSARQETVGPGWLLQEMLSPALLNQETVFTTVYVPKTGYHQTYRHGGSKR